MVKSQTFDPGADAAYGYRRKGTTILDTEEVAPAIMIDWDAEGQPVGVEVLHVSRRVAPEDLESFPTGLVKGLFAERSSRAKAAE